MPLRPRTLHILGMEDGSQPAGRHGMEWGERGGGGGVVCCGAKCLLIDGLMTSLLVPGSEIVTRLFARVLCGSPGRYGPFLQLRDMGWSNRVGL